MIYCMNHHLLHDLDFEDYGRSSLENHALYYIGVLFGDLDSSTNVFICTIKELAVVLVFLTALLSTLFTASYSLFPFTCVIIILLWVLLLFIGGVIKKIP